MEPVTGMLALTREMRANSEESRLVVGERMMRTYKLLIVAQKMMMMM